MTKLKTTPWFPTRVKPARVGYYEAKYSGCNEDEVCMRYWDGVEWRISPTRIALFGLGGITGDKWRGLAEQPR